MKVDRFWLEETTLNEVIRSENDLMLGILLNALYDLLKKGRERRLALDYFLSKDEDWPFSFNFVCKHLGINRMEFLKTLGITECGQKLDIKKIRKLPKSIMPLKAGCN